MKMKDKIEKIFEQLQLNENNLSGILPQLYTIALECGDYEGFCLLFCWEKPIGPSKIANKPQYDEAKAILKEFGLNNTEIEQLISISIEKYLDMRQIKDNQICKFSARELENIFERSERILETLEVPENLHPLDLYYYNQTISSQKLKILETIQIYEEQYSVLRGFITSKLTRYQAVINKKERIRVVEESSNSKKVFIIHGHNEAKWRELKEMLQNMFGLEPVVLAEQPDQGLTIIEKFEKYASQCAYAFAIFTPDDIVEKDGMSYFQARPNVIFELGWFYSNLGRSRVCILDQESEKSKIFSDLQGIMRKQFKESTKEKSFEIENELRSTGIIK